mmetsp:Transcript_11195/g.19633  ORF Transcript_11195/g.19633 Transcript_11195/m.19633 type:complete len:291 (-) Transcript_11195:1173-2045(-)
MPLNRCMSWFLKETLDKLSIPLSMSGLSSIIMSSSETAFLATSSTWLRTASKSRAGLIWVCAAGAADVGAAASAPASGASAALSCFGPSFSCLMRSWAHFLPALSLISWNSRRPFSAAEMHFSFLPHIAYGCTLKSNAVAASFWFPSFRCRLAAWLITCIASLAFFLAISAWNIKRRTAASFFLHSRNFHTSLALLQILMADSQSSLPKRPCTAVWRVRASCHLSPNFLKDSATISASFVPSSYSSKQRCTCAILADKLISHSLSFNFSLTSCRAFVHSSLASACLSAEL